jgi:hypothetical protein
MSLGTRFLMIRVLRSSVWQRSNAALVKAAGINDVS